MSTAIVTGASRGLGLELARALARRGWALVVDARGRPALDEAAAELAAVTEIRAIPGDVWDEAHRRELVAAAQTLGDLELVVNNASVLGPSPQPALARYPLDVLRAVYEINVFAPLRLLQLALPLLRPQSAAGFSSRPGKPGVIVNVTSDAAVEGYEGWGGYGSSKAALEQLTNVLAAEHPELRIYRLDPGDMRTQMHQEAFPGEDISDRPPPSAAVPGVIALLEGDLPSGRYAVTDLVPMQKQAG